MTKRNSNFSIYAHLRMLLKTIPMRNEATLRLAIAARIEADEATGEVFPRGDKSPRQHLQDVANVPRATSLNDSMAEIVKQQLLLPQRQYTKGTRKQGGDKLFVNWDHWEEACLPVSGNQAPCLPVSGNQDTTFSGNQPNTLSGNQHNKDTAIVTATVTPTKPRPLSVNLQPPKVPTASTPLDSKKAGGELQMQPEKSISVNGGIPWVEVAVMKADWGKARVEQAAYFDRKTGRLALVNNAAGMALYDQLRSDGYPIEVVKSGIAAAAGRAHREITQSGARAGALEGLIRQYCQYALEKAASNQQRSQEPPAYVTYGGGKFQL